MAVISHSVLFEWSLFLIKRSEQFLFLKKIIIIIRNMVLNVIFLLCLCVWESMSSRVPWQSGVQRTTLGCCFPLVLHWGRIVFCFCFCTEDSTSAGLWVFWWFSVSISCLALGVLRLQMYNTTPVFFFIWVSGTKLIPQVWVISDPRMLLKYHSLYEYECSFYLDILIYLWVIFAISYQNSLDMQTN